VTAAAAAAPVVVVGAGAAGLMAAISAAEAGSPVLVLERTRDGGRKILISGGGRCNVLPSVSAPQRYVTSSSRNTLRRLLDSWPLAEQRRFFERDLGIPLALEPGSGKLFPRSNRARDVRDRLVAYAADRGVVFRFDTLVTGLERMPATGSWRVTVAGAAAISARAVILATGGLSVPQTGSDGTGLRIAASLGHAIHDTYPALTPLTCEPPRHAKLAGVSLPVTIEAGTGRDRLVASGGFLFTHRGYSGPAVLDVSHIAVRGPHAGADRPELRVRWTALDRDGWDAEIRSAGSRRLASLVRQHLPQRLADALLAETGIPPDTQAAQLRRGDRARLLELLTGYPLPWTGSEGYRKAEVTGGGVALEEVDPRTLESRRHPGLFLCGEMLDAFGPIGGYNFLWAWSTGRAAGRGAASRASA